MTAGRTARGGDRLRDHQADSHQKKKDTYQRFGSKFFKSANLLKKKGTYCCNKPAPISAGI
jgi:hypothetical protein